MPAYVTETIIWTCVIAFVVCVGVALRIVIKERNDPAVRKWLLVSVLFVVVGGVATFAGGQFVPDQDDEAAEGTQTNSQSADNRPPANDGDRPDGLPAPIIAGPAPAEPDAPEAPSQAPGDRAVPASEAVASWADAELGQRPTFNPAAFPYPQCVATLRQQESVSRSDARACRTELETLHRKAIVGFYNVKAPYDLNLKYQEQAIRQNGINADPEQPRYDYVVAEMNRLNGDDSQETAAVHDLEKKLLDDIDKCRNALCQAKQ